MGEHFSLWDFLANSPGLWWLGMARENLRERASDRSLWIKLAPLLIPILTTAGALSGTYFGMQFSLREHDHRLNKLEAAAVTQTQALTALTAAIAGVQATQAANRDINIRQDGELKELRNK